MSPHHAGSCWSPGSRLIKSSPHTGLSQEWVLLVQIALCTGHAQASHGRYFCPVPFLSPVTPHVTHPWSWRGTGPLAALYTGPGSGTALTRTPRLAIPGQTLTPAGCTAHVLAPGPWPRAPPCPGSHRPLSEMLDWRRTLLSARRVGAGCWALPAALPAFWALPCPACWHLPFAQHPVPRNGKVAAACTSSLGGWPAWAFCLGRPWWGRRSQPRTVEERRAPRTPGPLGEGVVAKVRQGLRPGGQDTELCSLLG